MSESYFTKLTNEILDASEKLTDRFEEGFNILWGELSQDGSSSGSGASTPQAETTNDEFEGWGDDSQEHEAEVMDESSPLAGIAESVMGDIMAAQVRVCAEATG